MNNVDNINSETLETALKNSFSASYKLDDELRNKTLNLVIEKQKAREKRKEDILLIILQILMFVLTITIITLAFLLDVGSIIIFIFISNALIFSLVSLGIIINNNWGGVELWIICQCF